MPVIDNDSFEEAVRPRRNILSGLALTALSLLAFFPRLSRAMSRSTIAEGRTAAVLPASRRFIAVPADFTVKRKKP